jgi:hypothetical protein
MITKMFGRRCDFAAEANGASAREATSPPPAAAAFLINDRRSILVGTSELIVLV